MTLNKPRVLHVVAGRGLPVYFANAIRSVRAAAPVDRVLVIDNATPSLEFRREIIRIVEQDEKMDLILRPENELQNRKVGGLYEAYRLGFAYAIERGFHLLHLIQSDAQLLWWDDDLVERAVEIFDNHPACVNISTMLLPRDRRLGDELLRMPSADRLIYLRGYGLTDTGLYHLDRWRKHGFDFGPSEGVHGKHYRDLGFEVIYHPWPTVAPIPWPTVIRSGVQRGTEVATGKPFLLKPMSRADAWHMKAAMTEVWLEEFCIPWGWVCPTPMWVTGLETVDYWVLRYRDARRHGLSCALPRIERRGVSQADRRGVLGRYIYRPTAYEVLMAWPGRCVARKVQHIRRGITGRLLKLAKKVQRLTSVWDRKRYVE